MTNCRRDDEDFDPLAYAVGQAAQGVVKAVKAAHGRKGMIKIEFTVTDDGRVSANGYIEHMAISGVTAS